MTAPGPKIVTPKPPPLPAAGPPIPSTNEGVLAAGTQLVAKTADGRIKIEAGPGTRRIYTWDGLRRGAILKPRQTPFAGASDKGLYFKGKPKVWAPAEGITRLRAEEGKRNFANVSDAKIWMQIRRLYYVYNDRGLAVGWKRQGNTLHVSLWQFYIHGKQPEHMPGAQDGDIQVGPGHAMPQKMKPRLVFADGHTEPYTTETASQYPGAHVAEANPKAHGAAKTSGGKNWFTRHIVEPIKNAVGGGQ